MHYSHHMIRISVERMHLLPDITVTPLYLSRLNPVLLPHTSMGTYVFQCSQTQSLDVIHFCFSLHFFHLIMAPKCYVLN